MVCTIWLAATVVGFSVVSQAALALTAKVVNHDGIAIVGAKVTVTGSDTEMITDSIGQANIPSGPVDELHIDAAGYSHKVLHLHGAASEPLVITLMRAVIEEVDVVGVPLHASIMEAAQPITVLSAQALRDKQASTLGETLKYEVGVNSSYYGPVASSPIIRGLDGPRVLIAQNGLDVGDASRIGGDHIVATEASTAQQIEVLRGPATLFYGSGAIGGVINIVDDRVPTDNLPVGALNMQHNTVANETEISAATTGGKNNIAFHADGFWRDGDDYAIASRNGSPDILANSASRSQGGNIGGSWLLDGGHVGLSYGRLERLNGIPGHGHDDHDDHEGEDLAGEPAHADDEHSEDEHEVQSELRQDRWQFHNDYQFGGDVISRVNTRIGYTDYEHAEIENGKVGTVFKNKTSELRMDVYHQEWQGWRGALALDFKKSDFVAVGEEAFTPPSATQSRSLAVMEEKHHGDFLWQLGARVEHVSLDAEALSGSDAAALKNRWSFTPVSVSAGVVWDVQPSYKLALSLSNAQRAPSAAELFAYGPHIGTGNYEVGALYTLDEATNTLVVNNQIDVETSQNIDISWRKYAGDTGFVFNIFYNNINDFYYQNATGLTAEDILPEHDAGDGMVYEDEHANHDQPVFIMQQQDVRLYGAEAEWAWQMNSLFKWRLWGDSTKGQLRDGSEANLPRIPAARVGSDITFALNAWRAALSTMAVLDQNATAPDETATDGYTLIDINMSYTLPVAQNEVSLFFKGSNLLNEYAQVHSSFIKDVAPLPGRGFSVGLRGSF